MLPNISVELNGTKVLKEYVGKQVYFVYEYIQGGQYISDTIECDVLGVYDAEGAFEANPIYMSMDLFENVLKNTSSDTTGVARAEVFLENVESMDKIVSELEKLGVEVFFETTLDDYITSLEGFGKVGMAVACIIMLLALVIMLQAIMTNLRKRYTIIGILKAYGYSDLIICVMVWLEVFVYSAVAVMISLLACKLLGEKMNEFFSMFLSGVVFVLDAEKVILLFTIAIVISIIALLIPIRRLRKINVIDVLKAD